MSKTMQAGLAGVVVVVVGRLAAAGRLPKNKFAGIRIPSTMRSDAAWLAGHQAGATALTLAGAGPVAMAVVGRVRAARRSDGLLARLATAWMLGWIVVATVQANRAAQPISAR